MSDACDRCGGKGYRWDGGREVPCRYCKGTGRRLLTDRWEPACMTAEELAFWHEANDVVRRVGKPADRPCRDCPAAFAFAMRLRGACNGEPAERGRVTGWRKAPVAA